MADLELVYSSLVCSNFNLYMFSFMYTIMTVATILFIIKGFGGSGFNTTSIGIIAIVTYINIHFIILPAVGNEISEEKYRKVYLSIKDNPDLISVLPNYTTKRTKLFKKDAECIINRCGYHKLMNLINSTNIENEINKLRKYKVKHIQKECQQTVFSGKNIAEVQK